VLDAIRQGGASADAAPAPAVASAEAAGLAAPAGGENGALEPGETRALGAGGTSEAGGGTEAGEQATDRERIEERAGGTSRDPE
jgi:hypothetical protein